MALVTTQAPCVARNRFPAGPDTAIRMGIQLFMRVAPGERLVYVAPGIESGSGCETLARLLPSCNRRLTGMAILLESSRWLLWKRDSILVAVERGKNRRIVEWAITD